jgi:hypothetical protein
MSQRPANHITTPALENATAGIHAPNMAITRPNAKAGAARSEMIVAAIVGTVAPPSLQEGSFISVTLGPQRGCVASCAAATPDRVQQLRTGDHIIRVGSESR